MKDMPTEWGQDVAAVLRENGLVQAPVADKAVPQLTLQPRVTRLPRGVYAYSVLGYLEMPGSKEALRVFVATAIRDQAKAGPGLRQALLDAIANVAVRVKASAPDSPIKRLLVAGAPAATEPQTLVPQEKLKVRIHPFPPPLPTFARARGIAGIARADVQIDEQGRPVRADLIQGPPELSMIMLSYAMDWSFAPSAEQGIQAPYHTEIRVVFDPGAGLPATGLPPNRKERTNMQ